MNDKDWFESFFGEDYFEIYESTLTPQVADAQVEGIVSLLGLKPGARILDLACGHGRHAIPLAKRGYDVTGYDLSGVFLERARADAEAQGANVRWTEGDMRELSFENQFDGVINIFTAFGYFDDPRDDLKTLIRVRDALKPSGRFLLETIHRDALPARFQAKGFDRTSRGSIVLREREWDLALDVIDEDLLLIHPDGTRIQYKSAVRVRSLHQYLALLHEAGLDALAWYGGLDGTTLQLTSRRLVLLSQRAAEPGLKP